MVGQLILERLERLGLTQYQLAKKSGVGQGNISKLISGQYRMPLRRNRDNLGRVLGLSEEDWFRAAGVLPPARQPVPTAFDAALPDDPLPSDAEIVAAIEAIDDAKFQRQRAVLRAEVSPATYLLFCRQIYQSQKQNREALVEAFHAGRAG